MSFIIGLKIQSNLWFISAWFSVILIITSVKMDARILILILLAWDVNSQTFNEPTTTTTQNPEGPTHPMDNPNWRPPVGPPQELEIDYWLKSGQKLLVDQLQKNNLNKKLAKNIIMVIGDGLDLSTQMATRVYLGGENFELSFEKFPYTGLSKTYCVNYQVPDSGCTATAFLGGVKSNYGTIGVGASVPLRNCDAHTEEQNVESIFKFAQDAEMASGIVTTSRITHATPAVAYSHSAARYWENSNEIMDTHCVDIATQLVHGKVGKRLNVIFGGGRRELLPTDLNGSRLDGKNLVKEWIQSKIDQNQRPAYVENRAGMMNLQTDQLDYIMGLFQSNHMSYNLERDAEIEPSLAEMSLKALDLLERKGRDSGYILLIEASRIDHAHHATYAKLALDETAEMHRAVEEIMKRVNTEDTLVLVTADHSHTMTVGGYPIRGNDIFSKGDFSREDGMWFFTLNYANGMGYFDHVEETGGRRNPLGMSFGEPRFRGPATVPLDYETHGGDDVGVYAIGPYAHIFTGAYEQHYIAHGLMYAACIGNGLTPEGCDRNGAEKLKIPVLATVAMFLAIKSYSIILF